MALLRYEEKGEAALLLDRPQSVPKREQADFLLRPPLLGREEGRGGGHPSNCSVYEPMRALILFLIWVNHLFMSL